MDGNKIVFTLRLDTKIHAKIKMIAKTENRSMTNMIIHFIKKEISSYESANGEIILTDEDLYIE